MSFPRNVQLLLTERCNLACSHCAVPEELSPASRELTTAEWMECVEMFAHRGLDSVTIAGGEALLRRDAIAIAVHARAAGIHQVTIVSNGTVMGPRTVAELVDAQVSSGVRLHVSVDGATSKSHDSIRGLGSLRRTTAFIDRVRQQGGWVDGLQCVVSRRSFDEIEQVAQLAQSLGCRFLILFGVAPVGRAAASYAELSLGRVEWEKILETTPTWSRQYGLEIHVHGPILGPEWPITKDSLVPMRVSAHGEMVVVGPDGEMFTCPPLRHLSLGNLVEQTREELEQALERGATLMRSACHACSLQLMCCGTDSRLDFVRASIDFGNGDAADVVARTL